MWGVGQRLALLDQALASLQALDRGSLRHHRAHHVVELLTERAHRGPGERLEAIRHLAQFIGDPGARRHGAFEIFALPDSDFAPSPCATTRISTPSVRFPAVKTGSPTPARADTTSAMAGMTATLPFSTSASPNELISSSGPSFSTRALRDGLFLSLGRQILETLAPRRARCPRWRAPAHAGRGKRRRRSFSRDERGHRRRLGARSVQGSRSITGGGNTEPLPESRARRRRGSDLDLDALSRFAIPEGMIPEDDSRAVSAGSTGNAGSASAMVTSSAVPPSGSSSSASTRPPLRALDSGSASGASTQAPLRELLTLAPPNLLRARARRAMPGRAPVRR